MIFCVLYLKRNVCPQLVETTLLRWRAEKSLKHYSRSLLACLALSTGPQQHGLTNTATNPTPAPRKMTGYRSYQTDSQSHRQQERRADRWTDWQTDIARQLRWCQPKFRGVEVREGREQVPQFRDGIIYHSFSAELEKLYLFAGRWF